MLSQHRCTKCGAKDSYTIEGRHNCMECCEKGRAYRRGVRCERPPARSPEELEERIRETHREYQRERRSLFRAHHCCTECGKQDALTLAGKSRCQSCTEQKNRRPYLSNEERKLEQEDRIEEPRMTRFERSERAENGFCYLCGQPVKEGTTDWSGQPFRICEKHYEILKAAGVKGRESYQRTHNGKNPLLHSVA